LPAARIEKQISIKHQKAILFHLEPAAVLGENILKPYGSNIFKPHPRRSPLPETSRSAAAAKPPGLSQSATDGVNMALFWGV
jgi:hypothetical protein